MKKKINNIFINRYFSYLTIHRPQKFIIMTALHVIIEQTFKVKKKYKIR